MDDHFAVGDTIYAIIRDVEQFDPTTLATTPLSSGATVGFTFTVGSAVATQVATQVGATNAYYYEYPCPTAGVVSVEWWAVKSGKVSRSLPETFVVKA